MSKSPTQDLPRWADVGLLPLINLLMAFGVAGVVLLVIGLNPIDALTVMIRGAFLYDEGIGYTLYYATNCIFTGLAVAMAFYAGLFNIGGEGQATMGGVLMAAAILSLDQSMPFAVILPAAILTAALGGAIWAAIPAWLQAYRGSHIVITTIMFNFIAMALSQFLLVNAFMEVGKGSPESRRFSEQGTMPALHDILGWVGIELTPSPANFATIIALLLCLAFWAFVWRTRWGYKLRTVGESEGAARYAGIRVRRVIIWSMCISGGLAGLLALNEIMGAQQRLIFGFSGGYGFTGIAVALMGRNHPIGIILASLLFGMLYQGGAELSFEYPNEASRELVVAIQGLVVLFSGALAFMARPWLERVFAVFARSAQVKEA